MIDSHAVRVEPAELPDGVAFTLIVPGEDVIIADAEIPPVRQAVRRQQAARYALEDKLAASVDHVHLALGPRNNDGHVPTAVVEHACMDGWLSMLDVARSRVTSGIIPDYLCLPTPTAESSELWLLGNRAILRLDANHGFSCEQTMLAYMLPAPEEEATTINVRVQADTNADALIEQLKHSGYQINIQDHPEPDQLWADLLAGSDGHNPINLLQGAYSPVSTFSKWWRPLRTTAVLAGVWLILATAAQGLHYYQLQQRYQHLQTQTRAEFRKAFPDVQAINNIWAQAEEEVRQLKASLGSDGLFPLLSATTRAIGGVPGLRMHSLQYRNGVLILNLQGDSIEDLEQLRAGFKQNSYAQLEIRSTETTEAGVDIRAHVSPESS